MHILELPRFYKGESYNMKVVFFILSLLKSEADGSRGRLFQKMQKQEWKIRGES